jgi:hypothetical protein
MPARPRPDFAACAEKRQLHEDTLVLSQSPARLLSNLKQVEHSAAIPSD